MVVFRSHENVELMTSPCASSAILKSQKDKSILDSRSLRQPADLKSQKQNSDPLCQPGDHRCSDIQISNVKSKTQRSSLRQHRPQAKPKTKTQNSDPHTSAGFCNPEVKSKIQISTFKGSSALNLGATNQKSKAKPKSQIPCAAQHTSGELLNKSQK